MSFVKRKIRVVITLAEGSFEGTESNTITLEGLRVIVNIAGAGGKYFGMLSCQIFGVTQKLVNQLTLVGAIGTVNVGNVIQVFAGDEGKTLTKVFEGNIYLAYGNYSAAPEAALVIGALPSAVNLVQPAEPLSYPGTVDAADVMATLAQSMGLKGFINHGVSYQLQSPYFFGSHVDQLRQCADAANIRLTIENGELSIWPLGGYREQEIPLISLETGMVGYPTFSQQGINVVSQFLPTAAIGTLVKIVSEVTPANGTFYVTGIVHQLESERPGGAWFTQVSTTPIEVTQ